MDDDNLGLKPEFLVNLYLSIDSKVKQLAPNYMRHELSISQDGRIKSKFYILVSNRMAPHLINAVQQRINLENGIDLRSYLAKLQEQVMSQLFGSHGQEPVNIQFDTRSFFPRV